MPARWCVLPDLSRLSNLFGCLSGVNLRNVVDRESRPCEASVTDRSRASPEASFLVELFTRLNAESLLYCVVGEHSGLPYDLRGSDVDILVSPSAMAKALQILRAAAAAHGGRCISRYSVEGAITCWCGKTEQWWGAHVDVFPCCGYRGLPYIAIDEILQNAKEWNGLWVASDEDSALYLILKECIYNARDRKNYAALARHAYGTSPDRITKLLKVTLGDDVASLWIHFLSSGGDSKAIERLSRVSRRALWLRELRSRPLHTLSRRARNLARRLGRVPRKAGAAVVVMGTDGSGKTTLVAGLVPHLMSALHHRPRCEHMRPNLLPRLGRLFGRPAPKGPVTDPHGSRPSGFAGSLLRLAYYTADYVLGYWLKVYPAMVKRPTIWIFDRYFYDYYIDPARGRIRLPKWIIRFFSVLVPKPDVILCLGADPEVIHRRKPELLLEEVRRQVDELRRFCEGNPRAVFIDVGRPVEECVDRALDAITERMARRYGWPDGD